MKSFALSAAAGLAALVLPQGGALASGPAASSLDKFATCAVKQYEGAELLATQPGSAEEAEVLAEYGRRSCAVPATSPDALRGAVAEQLFKADFTAIGSRPRRETIEVFTMDSEDVAAMDAAARRRLELLGFGTCVAAGDPTRAVALLQARAGSPDEARILAELQPQFSPCLAEGEKLGLGKSDLRSALAEGAYRLAIAYSTEGEDIVVTGTKDASRSVVCKTRTTVGSHVAQKSCMTAAQWKTRERDDELAAADMARKTKEQLEQDENVDLRTRYQPGN
jgi:hypothetical protein